MHGRPAPGLPPIAAFALLVALSACARSDDRADSAAASPATARPLVGAGAPAPALPGRLARPIERYSADEFAVFVRALRFGAGVSRARRCTGDSDCDLAAGKRTSARIDAVEGQHALNPDSLPADGVVVVQVRNTGALDERRYGLRPGPYEYYVVVLPRAGGGATWTLQELGVKGGTRTLAQVDSGVVTPCNHDAPKRYSANFASCATAHDVTDSTMRLGLVLQNGFDDPMWTRCLQGCCAME